MVGRVYRIALRGQYDDQPHPFVVVIEFAGTRDCLVVPGFSADGYKLNELIELYERQGYRRDQVVVELDNRQHIQFSSSYTGKDACWLTARFTRLSVSTLNGSTCIGQMDLDGLRRIAQGLLAVAETKPELFSGAALKKLRQVASRE